MVCASSLLRAQLEAARLPSIVVRIPFPCPNDIYEREMAAAIAQAKADGITHVIFGDLYLEDIRAYRVARLADRDDGCVSAMAAADRCAGARDDRCRMHAHLATVDLSKLPESFCGRRFDAALLPNCRAMSIPAARTANFIPS